MIKWIQEFVLNARLNIRSLITTSPWLMGQLQEGSQFVGNVEKNMTGSIESTRSKKNKRYQGMKCTQLKKNH